MIVKALQAAFKKYIAACEADLLVEGGVCRIGSILLTYIAHTAIRIGVFEVII